MSKYLGKDPAAISRALNYLETKGYINRRGENAKTNGVYLTEYANSRRTEIEAVADMVTERATSGMTQQQRNMIKKLLNKIYANTK
ncbi:MAG: MarR family winged helix-turn-helix transcriptional regulator [Paramuribaculum sp.]|nr:MarR family winged helix-turn-helix transcriptional regulator [Paramuribaculum sp.]